MPRGYRIPRDGRPILIPAEVAKRAYDRFVVDANGCHISTYSAASSGYSQVGWSFGGGRNQMVTGHRAAWTHVHGPIPLGLTIDHLCRVRRCVNVAHLRLLSNMVNASDNGSVRVNPGIGRFCRKGHELAETSTSHRSYCRECKNARRRQLRAERWVAA